MEQHYCTFLFCSCISLLKFLTLYKHLTFVYLLYFSLCLIESEAILVGVRCKNAGCKTVSYCMNTCQYLQSLTSVELTILRDSTDLLQGKGAILYESFKAEALVTAFNNAEIMMQIRLLNMLWCPLMVIMKNNTAALRKDGFYWELIQALWISVRGMI